VHFTIYMYLYLYSYRRETARQLCMYAQLTRCFFAVAELLVQSLRSGSQWYLDWTSAAFTDTLPPNSGIRSSRCSLIRYEDRLKKFVPGTLTVTPTDVQCCTPYFVTFMVNVSYSLLQLMCTCCSISPKHRFHCKNTFIRPMLSLA